MNPQDPLAQLRDIHLPNAVGWWPLAPGWWILAALLLAVLALGVWLWWKQKQANHYRVEAIAQLNQLWQQYSTDNDAETFLLQMSQLLRRSARAAFPNSHAETLNGQPWLQFLDYTSNDNLFTSGAGKLLATLHYQKLSADAPELKKSVATLHHCVMQWLLKHKRNIALNKPKRRAALGASHAAI